MARPARRPRARRRRPAATDTAAGSVAGTDIPRRTAIGRITMNPLARLRHLLARRPWLYWLGVGVVALAVGLVAVRAAASVDEARRRWGTTREVAVAVADLAPGDPLAGHVELRPRPAPMVPAAAVTELVDGARARQHVGLGEILVATDLVASAAPQALIPPGWSAVAVAEAVPSGAAVGDHVAAARGGVVVAREGIVVGQRDDAVLVAVPDDDAACGRGGERGRRCQPAAAAVTTTASRRRRSPARRCRGSRGRRRTAGSCACARTSACPTPRTSR